MNESKELHAKADAIVAQHDHGHVHGPNCNHDHDHDHHHGHHHHAKAETFVRTSPKVGRNDPCPCGSGKKHKKCCLA